MKQVKKYSSDLSRQMVLDDSTCFFKPSYKTTNMKKREDFKELDKDVSKSIMKEFEGKVINSVCTSCNGTGKIHHPFSGQYDHGITVTISPMICTNYNGKGNYDVQY